MTADLAVTEPGATTVDPARRGQVLLNDRVIEKIAGQAASEVAAAGGHSGGFLGIGGEADLATRPEVSVTTSGRTVALALRLGLAYPAPIRESTEAVRRHVSSRVEALTGLAVRRLDIDVAWLDRGRDEIPTPGRRRLE
jgi:uncharacterized alkaline shock family protein YloU